MKCYCFKGAHVLIFVSVLVFGVSGALSQHKNAERLEQKAAELIRAAPPAEHLGWDHVAAYREAFEHLQKALKIKEEQLGREHLDLVPLLKQIVRVCYGLGKIVTTEHYHRRILAIQEKHLSPDDPELAQTYQRLGEFYVYFYRPATAAHYYEQYYAIEKAKPDEDDMSLAPTLVRRGDILEKKGDKEAAAESYQRAISIATRRLGPENPSLLEPLKKLARIHSSQKRYDEAERLYRQALSIQESLPRPSGSEIRQLMESLAWVLRQNGKLYEAEGMYKRAMRDNDFDSMASVLGLIHVYGEQKRFDDAKALHRSMEELLAEAASGLKAPERPPDKHSTPSEVDAWTKYEVINNFKKRIDDALAKALRQADERKPENNAAGLEQE